MQKTMKTLLLTFGLLLASSGLFAQMTATDELIRVEVSENSTRNELLEIREALAEYNIDFRYTGVKWTDELLKSIGLQVIAEDGRTRDFVLQQMNANSKIVLIYRLDGVEDADFCLGLEGACE
jgi:hypothetical protein